MKNFQMFESFFNLTNVSFRDNYSFYSIFEVGAVGFGLKNAKFRTRNRIAAIVYPK